MTTVLREKLESMKQWRFTFSETAMGISVAVAITLWANTTFQTKVEAERERQQLEARLNAQETRLGAMEGAVYETRSDVAFIRGFLTPKNKKE